MVFTRFDALDLSQEGAIRQRRSTLENSQVQASLEALALYAVIAEAYGQGKFKVSFDVDIENEPMRFGPSRGKTPIDAAFCQWYFSPRINGGDYEAEDRVYRGPYDSVFFIHSGWKAEGEPTAIVNGMPVSGVAYAPTEETTPGQNMAIGLLNAWTQHVAFAAQRRGLSVQPFAHFGLSTEGAIISQGTELLASELMSIASNRSRVSSTDYIAQLTATNTTVSLDWSEVSSDPLRKLPKLDLPLTESSSPIQTIENEGKSILLIQVDCSAYVAPHLKADIGAKAIGWVQAKQDSKQPGQTYIAFTFNNPSDPQSDVALLELKDPATELGTSTVTKLSTLEEWTIDKPLEPNLYTFVPGADPLSVETKIAKALALTSESSQADKDAVVAMLTAREDAVRLNAAQAFTRIKEPTAEQPLIDMLASFNLRVCEIALNALANQGTPKAWEAIHKAMVNGRYNYVQQIAAKQIGTKNDPKEAAWIATLLATESWQTWLVGAEVLGALDDSKAQTVLMTFLWKTDPAVRLAATRLSMVKYELPVKRLLWSAINDSSDLVRAVSYTKLIECSDSSSRDEGYKGVRDDSVFVRLYVLDYLRQHPDEKNRSALRIAVADLDVEVRAAALKAFAALTSDVSPDEIQNTLTEKDPRIQKALIELVTIKKMKLTKETLTLLSTSVDPSVVARAKELAE